MTSASATGRSASSVVTPKAHSVSRSRSIAVPVKVIAGCRASGSTWWARAGLEHGHPVPAAGVHGHLPGLPGAGGRQAADEVRQRVVGHREEHELGPGDDGGDVGERHPGQQVGGPGPAGVAHGVGAGDVVAGPGERRAEHGTHPSGADDPHGEPGGVLDAVHERATYSYRTDVAAPVRDAGTGSPGRFADPRLPRVGTVRLVMLPWREAWHEALYGPRGFYRRPEGPAGHFTTSTHGPLGVQLADALGRLADREGVHHVVDVGCGRGELLDRTRRTAPRPAAHRRRRGRASGRPAGCRGLAALPRRRCAAARAHRPRRRARARARVARRGAVHRGRGRRTRPARRRARRPRHR